MLELNYVNSESTVYPTLVEVGVTTAYLRRNVASEKKTDGDTTYTLYKYEEAALPKADFEKHAAELMMNEQMNAQKTSETIIDNQATAETSQLSIMSAIAELYETLVLNGDTDSTEAS